MKLTSVGRRTVKAWSMHPRYISSCGGTRSSKTYSILQAFIIALVQEEASGRPATVNSVVSESMPHLQRGAIREFKTMMQTEGIWSAPAWNETSHTYTFGNGSILEFFSVDNAGKVHGPARDRLFINEAQNISYDIARQLFVRTRGLIVCDYNPTHSFWLNEKIEPRDNCITLHSTYLDNEFLTPEQVAEIESNMGDGNWWKVYGKGEVGTLEGLVYDFSLVDRMPPKGTGKPQKEKTAEELYADSLIEIQGLDFGFTNDPTARVQIFADPKRKVAWLRERCYRKRMINTDIAADMRADGVGRDTEVYADCAEPKSIAEIQREGFIILACDKDAPVRSDKLKFQLQWMQGWKFYVTKDSLNLIRELRNYTWAKDRDGNTLNYPIDDFNHCFVGCTLITTPIGMVRIDSLKQGDIVLTSNGARRVSRFFDNGLRRIIHERIKTDINEIELRATPDHKIKTTEGWKQLKDLKPGDTIFLCRYSTGNNIIYTEERNTFQKVASDYTEKCGKRTMGKSQRGIMSTTGTEIPLITRSATLNWLRGQSISRCIWKSVRSCLLTWIRQGLRWTMPGYLQMNGTGQKPEGSGMLNMAGLSPVASHYRHSPANGAEMNTSQSRIPKIDFVPIDVGQHTGDILELTTCKRPAQSAERHLPATNTGIPDVAVTHVLQGIEILNESIERVYDIEVEQDHEYFANGVLVHNCLDAARYALWTKFAERAGYGQYNISFNR